MQPQSAQAISMARIVPSVLWDQSDRRQSDRRHRSRVAEAYANKQISMRDWLTAKAPIERRINAAQKRLGRLQRTTVLGDYVGKSGRLRKQWESLNLDRQRAIVAAVLDHLDIGPAVQGRNSFDPKRVKPVWRR